MPADFIVYGAMTERERNAIDYLNTYVVLVYCPNCDMHDSIRVRKGTPKPEVVECPNCGCDILRT